MGIFMQLVSKCVDIFYGLSIEIYITSNFAGLWVLSSMMLWRFIHILPFFSVGTFLFYVS
jgi:hypothetical protein